MKFKACPKCQGDLMLDEDKEWRCFQCGGRVYPKPPMTTLDPMTWSRHHRDRVVVE